MSACCEPSVSLQLTPWACSPCSSSSELTAKVATPRKLTASSFWSHSSTSQPTHKMRWGCCEPSVSLQLTPWAWCELFARSTDKLTMQWKQLAHCESCKLKESSQQAHNVSLSCEFTMSWLSVLKRSPSWDNLSELLVSMVLAHSFTGLSTCTHTGQKKCRPPRCG